MTQLASLPFSTDERLACFGKVQHRTRQDAIRALSRMDKQKKAGGKLETYRCVHCASFHVGAAFAVHR